MQLKLFVIHVLVGIMILTLMLFNHIFTGAALATATAAEYQTDTKVEDKDTKQQLGTSETKSDDDNSAKQGEEEKDDEEQQESNDDTRASERGLEDNVIIDKNNNIYSSDDDDDNDDDKDVPFELPFDDMIPFP
jgi:cytoskeletal protein RodZ